MTTLNEMTQVNVKIRENKYINRDGIEVTNHFIKLNDLGVDQYIIVTKKYKEPKSFTATKDGKPFTVNKTLVDYNNQENIQLNITPASLEKWNNLPNGEVAISKVEFTGQDGKLRTTYNYQAL
jgi:hypothetical protein